MGIIHGFQTDGAQPSPIWIYGDGQYLINYNTVLTVVTTVDTTSTIITFSQQNALTITGDPSVQLIADLKAFISSGGTIPIVQVDSLRWAIPTVVTWDGITGKPTFATVATSGSYTDLSNKPAIPAAQVNSDWSAVSGVAEILNKPTTFAPTVHGMAAHDSTVAPTAAPTLTGQASINTNDSSTKGLVVRGSGTVASPVLPTSITGLVGWYKADALALTNGAAVATWTDSSGLGHDLIQLTGTKQPIYVTNALNGLPVVRNTGSKWMDVNFALSQPVTVFYVYKKAVGVALGTFFDGYVLNSLRNYWNTATSGELNAGTGLTITYPPLVDDGGYHIYESVFNGASSYLYQDATYKGSGNPNTTAANGFSVFSCGGHTGGLNMLGDIAEIVVYNAALSDTDRKSVEAYLSNKYALGIQAANLQEWQTSIGGVPASIDNAGNIVSPVVHASYLVLDNPGGSSNITQMGWLAAGNNLYATMYPSGALAGIKVVYVYIGARYIDQSGGFRFNLGASERVFPSGGNGLGLSSTHNVAWASGAMSAGNQAVDTGISRVAAGVVVVGNGTVGNASGTLKAATLSATGLPVYANNAAAITGGLAVGDFYRTGADPDLVCVVH